MGREESLRRVRRSAGQDTNFRCLLDRLPAAVNSELMVDLFEVAVYRLGRDHQLRCDLFVLEAPGQQLEDTQLAVGQAHVACSGCATPALGSRHRFFDSLALAGSLLRQSFSVAKWAF